MKSEVTPSDWLMNCWILSSCVVDPTLDVVSDDCSNPLSGMASSAAVALVADEEADESKFSPSWLFDDDAWLSEHRQLSGMDWYDVRSPSPLFPSSDADRLLRDLWMVSPSLLLQVNDDDLDIDCNRTPMTAGWKTWHLSTSTDNDCPVSRCPSRNPPSRDPSPTLTGADLDTGSTDPGSSPSSRSTVGDQWRPWKRRRRRRRRRHRRWSRQYESRPQHISSAVDCSVDHPGAQILRSLLLHGSQHRGYRSTRRQASESSVDVGPVTSDGALQQLRRTASSPLIVRRLSTDDDADVAARRRRCLEDHCYFNSKQTSSIASDCRVGRCEDTRQAAWSAVNSAPTAPVSRHFSSFWYSHVHHTCSSMIIYTYVSLQCADCFFRYFSVQLSTFVTIRNLVDSFWRLSLKSMSLRVRFYD